MVQDKKCESCKYFKSYYAIRDGRLKVVGGYCNNDEVHPYVSKIKYEPKPCDKWQRVQKRSEIWRNDINNILKDMQKSLADIALILKDE